MGKRLLVEPTQCLLTDDMSIKVEDLNKFEIVEIEVEMTDNFGEFWTSSVMVQANLFGEVDLAKSVPILGSYTAASTMAIFWSMKRDGSCGNGQTTPLQPLKVNITLKRNGAAEEVVQVVRHLIHPSLVRQPMRVEDLVGTFFHHGDRRKRPTILVLGGSEGGLWETQAALLAAKGFNTFALDHLEIQGVPSQHINIPHEYFQKAIAWLEQQPYVDPQHLAVVGTSKFGEQALLLSSYEPRIKAVVAYVPSSGIHQRIEDAINGKKLSLAFSYHQSKVGELTNEPVKLRNACQALGYREWYQIHTEARMEPAIIQVEKTNGPILIISGGDDRLWRSDIFGNKIIDRLKKHSFCFLYEHQCYPLAGHVIGYPGMPTTESTEFKFGTVALQAGGTPESNFNAQRDSWNKVIAFLKQSL